ncbi:MULTISPECIES: hypothetical protein [unclassified Nocardioides]|uniref:hypothetical protein n=1 Tax=unclassified Nocardioides TaxID=2615069 RepID=UPI00005717DB|nr:MULTISPECIES: hypothetical protein [unclassified Nocardioides]ABL80406.1 hypothetical protein Noca_0883 [Nocardioides sp. JS614]
MSEHRIVEVDPFDPGQVDPWHGAYLAAELAAPEGVTSPWQLEEVRAMMQDQGTRYRDIATTVHEAGNAYRWGTLVRPDAHGPTSAW